MKFFHKLKHFLDDFKIKTKFYILYIFCMLIPLVMTDSVIIYIVLHSNDVARQHEMENMANAVRYTLFSSIDRAAELAQGIYMNKYIESYLNKQYENPLDYVTNYYSFFKDTLFANEAGMDHMYLTMYSDNETIVNGAEFHQIDTIRDRDWYKFLMDSGQKKVLYFDYDEGQYLAVEPKRKIYFLQKLDYHDKNGIEKLLRIEIDYSSMIRTLEKMNYDTDIFICSGNRIVLSNGKNASVGKRYDLFSEKSFKGYTQSFTLYGNEMAIYIMQKQTTAFAGISQYLSLIFFLVFLNAVLPILMMLGINRSFTNRIGRLIEAFKNVDHENFAQIEDVKGKDEIGDLARGYNEMATRINTLVQIVYKNRIREQEMTVARQNAELLALHSQINPHFLFNTLESIRMHSIIKDEMETAEMVEKLALLQRQYVDWGNDSIEIIKEMEFVDAYLRIQKYRFGQRLSYELDIDPQCEACQIPKLTIVTFVENACVHGIESKTSPGWIFLRIYRQKGDLIIEIEDTGQGMDAASMDLLLQKMRNASMELLQEKGRVGIVNACLRLKMVTENEVTFDLDGEQGFGLMVQIKIPWKYVE